MTTLRILFSIFWLGSVSVLCQDADLVFMIIGDWGDSFYWEEHSPQNNVSRAMNEWAGIYKPKFILSTGDNFYPDGVRSHDDVWFEQKWRQIYTGEHIRDLQWRISLGNHDYDPKEDRPGPNDGGNEMFQVYRSEVDPLWECPWLWWEFTESSPAGDVHFIVTDTEAIQEQFNNYTEQLVWFEETVAASTAEVKLVVGHLNVYTIGGHAPGYHDLWETIEPVMRQYGVDAYISGHDHNMQHIAFANGTGHDYIISGGGGRGLYELDEEWEKTFHEQGFVTEFREEHGFSGVFINSTTLLCNQYDQYGNLLFDIVRPIGAFRKTIFNEF